jgi:hypothetical protein
LLRLTGESFENKDVLELKSEFEFTMASQSLLAIHAFHDDVDGRGRLNAFLSGGYMRGYKMGVFGFYGYNDNQ